MEGLSKFITSSFDKRSERPWLYKEFYDILYREKKDFLSAEYEKRINKNNSFYLAMESLRNINILYCTFKLLKHYLNGNFAHYRGNIKVPLCDCIFLAKKYS